MSSYNRDDHKSEFINGYEIGHLRNAATYVGILHEPVTDVLYVYMTSNTCSAPCISPLLDPDTGLPMTKKKFKLLNSKV